MGWRGNARSVDGCEKPVSRRSRRDRGGSRAENAENAEKNAAPPRSPRELIARRRDPGDTAFLCALSALCARPSRSRRETNYPSRIHDPRIADRRVLESILE